MQMGSQWSHLPPDPMQVRRVNCISFAAPHNSGRRRCRHVTNTQHFLTSVASLPISPNSQACICSVGRMGVSTLQGLPSSSCFRHSCSLVMMAGPLEAHNPSNSYLCPVDRLTLSFCRIGASLDEQKWRLAEFRIIKPITSATLLATGEARHELSCPYGRRSSFNADAPGDSILANRMAMANRH